MDTYYAHALGKLVGPRGHVYVITAPATDGLGNSALIKGRLVTGDLSDDNVTKVEVQIPITSIPISEKLDLIWADQWAYLFLDSSRPFEAQSLKPRFSAVMFKPISAALKPGGRFIQMDADVEINCFDRTHDCPNSRPRLLHSIPHSEMAALIKQAGLELDFETNSFIDTTYKGFLPPTIWGQSSATYAMGYPFLWKFHRPTGPLPFSALPGGGRLP
jgi:hypothetical protein